MSASPFRSHLLQQWAKSNQQRPPAAVVPWLKPKRQQQPLPLVEEEDDSSSHRRQRHGRRHQHHHHHHGSSPRRSPPSLSSVDSAAFSSWQSTVSRDNSSSPSRQTTRFFETSSAARNSPDGDDDQVVELKNNEIESNNNSAEEDGIDDDNDEEESFPSSMSSALCLQSFLLNRRTATRLTHCFEKREAEGQLLRAALDRAVECAQMAPNHKRTEPFSFRRFLAGSLAAQQLAEIPYQVTLSSCSSAPNAEAKRKKWLEIPAFLVTLVHENQSSSVSTTTSPYEPLPYTPPETERQLEDYAAACTGVQNALLSLHAEGIGSKWATGPVIQTPAFRELVQAQATDRVAALIMVGGSTEFASDRERQGTEVRRHRRRSLRGDLVVDLP